MKGCFGVIIGNRDVFPGSLAEEGRKEIVDTLKREGIDAILPLSNQTKYGAIENFKEAKKCADLFRENRERIDGILVSLPNFGDERAIADTIRMSTLSVPVLIQAYPDELSRMDIENRRDSFCGKLSVCSNLKQYGIPFSLTRLHTVSLSSKDFLSDLGWFMGVCRVVKGLSQARIGAIGARTTPFKTVRFSERLLQNSGISVETADLSQVIMAVEKLKDSDKEVQNHLRTLTSYCPTSKVPSSALLKMAKLAIVLNRWIKENELNACALRCWPELQNSLGIFPCAVMSMMSNSLLPCACETDVMGAIAMYVLQLASTLPAGLFDWNNNYGTDPDKLILFHCSNLPKTMLSTCHMEYNAIDARARGTDENSYGTCVGRVKPGPMTFARISTDEIEGKITAYVGEGEFTDDALETFGAVGVVKINRLQELLQLLCRKGFEHHVAISQSWVGRIILETMRNYLGWDIYYHNGQLINSGTHVTLS